MRQWCHQERYRQKQEVVRHLKDEPASLDPINAVGLTEAQVQRDLFGRISDRR